MNEILLKAYFEAPEEHLLTSIGRMLHNDDNPVSSAGKISIDDAIEKAQQYIAEVITKYRNTICNKLKAEEKVDSSEYDMISGALATITEILSELEGVALAPMLAAYVVKKGIKTLCNE